MSLLHIIYLLYWVWFSFRFLFVALLFTASMLSLRACILICVVTAIVLIQCCCSCYPIGFMAFAYMQKWGNRPEGWLSVVCPETGAAHWQTPQFNWAAGMEELCLAQDPTVLVLGRTIVNSAS